LESAAGSATLGKERSRVKEVKRRMRRASMLRRETRVWRSE